MPGLSQVLAASVNKAVGNKDYCGGRFKDLLGIF